MPPPVFFLKSKNRPLYVENKILSGNCLGSFQKNDLPMKSIRLPLRKLRQFNNYELTVMTLKGETFPGFKIQR